MKVRQEQPRDYPEIYELIKNAFATAPNADGDEQDYTNKLRESERYIPELALVAEKEGCLVGHVMFTATPVKYGENTYWALLLSPLCVELSYRNTGIGALLVEEGLKRAKEMGYSAVFVVGDPKYYRRFGFACASEFDITNEGDIPEQFVMALELEPGALTGKKGTIRVV